MKTADFVVDRIAECPSGIIDSLKTALKKKGGRTDPKGKGFKAASAAYSHSGSQR